MYFSIRLGAYSSNDIFVIHLPMFRWWIPLVHCSDYRYLLLTFVQNKWRKHWLEWISLQTRQTTTFHLNRPQRPPSCYGLKCYFICIGFALLWNFFLIELRSFRFLNTIFLLLVSKQTYTETILNCLHLKHLTFQLFPGIASPYSQVVTRFPLTVLPICASLVAWSVWWSCPS